MWIVCLFLFKQKTAYEMRISDWSSDVCSSDLLARSPQRRRRQDMGASPALMRSEGPDHRFSVPMRAHSAPSDAGGERGVGTRSEERRVGKECVSTCRFRRSPVP